MVKKKATSEVDTAAACEDEAVAVASEKKRLKKEKNMAIAVDAVVGKRKKKASVGEGEDTEVEKTNKKKKERAVLDDEEAAAIAKAERKRLKKERKLETLQVEEETPCSEAEARAEKKRKKEERKAAMATETMEENEGELTIKNDKQAAASSHKVPCVVDVAQNSETSFRVFVGGLPSHVDEAQIRKDFSECGKITDLILARWPEDGSSKGICFLTFADESAMNACIKWNGEYYENKPLRIERKEGPDKPKKVDMGKGGQRGHKPDNCLSVAVLDMSRQTTEENLWTFFEDCGSITSVKILKHRETYESRGIAFITFDDTSGTDKAVKLSGKMISSKSVRVEYAAPKNEKGKGSGKAGLDSRPEGCSSVVVSNLSMSTSEDDLWNLVRDCESANNVSILVDKLTFASKGIAFIDFDEPADTDIAVKLNGTEVGGKAVTVRYKV